MWWTKKIICLVIVLLFTAVGCQKGEQAWYKGPEDIKEDIQRGSSEKYNSLEWRILYLKKLENWQSCGAYKDYYGGTRVGKEISKTYSINGPFHIKVEARTFDSGLNSYYDWIIVTKCNLMTPEWEFFGDEEVKY